MRFNLRSHNGCARQFKSAVGAIEPESARNFRLLSGRADIRAAPLERLTLTLSGRLSTAVNSTSAGLEISQRMITRHEMFQPMLDACPSFVSALRELVAEWKDDDDGLPLYLALGHLAAHLVDLVRQGKTEQFATIFDVVERWHCEGEHYVKEAATVGLLEGLQNRASNTDLDPRIFEPWLGPQSKRWWDKLNLFWSEERLLSED